MYSSLRKKLNHQLIKSRIERSSPEHKVLREIAYERAAIAITHTIGWPFRCPDSRRVVNRVMLNAKKRHLAIPKKNDVTWSHVLEKMLAKNRVEGMLMLSSGPGYVLESRDTEVVLGVARKTANQLWTLDKEYNIIPQGQPKVTALAVAGASMEKNACVVHGPFVEDASNFSQARVYLFPSFPLSLFPSSSVLLSPLIYRDCPMKCGNWGKER